MLLDPCHKLSHLLGPPLERDVLYGRPLYVCYSVYAKNL